jgi:hypothetical protein
MKDLELIRFCEFLDQQKEYRIADTIIGNLSKTAMRQNHHTENITLDKIIDLSSMYVLANPNSTFIKIANTPAAGPNYIDIFNFLLRIGFEPSEFNKDIYMDIVEQKFRIYSRKLRGGPTPKEQQLYETIRRTGFDKANGKRIIVPNLQKTLSSLANFLPSETKIPSSEGPKSTTPNQETKSNPAPPTKNPSPQKGSDATKTTSEGGPYAQGSAAGGFSAANPPKPATPEQVSKWKLFCGKLAQTFPKFGSHFLILKNIAGPVIGVIFSFTLTRNIINKINTQGQAEAWDSPQDWIEAISAFNLIISTITGLYAAGIMITTAGAGAPASGVLAALTAGFGFASAAGYAALQVGDMLGFSDPLDKLPKDKSNESNVNAKPESKPSSQAPAAPKPEPTAPKAPKKRVHFNPVDRIRPL